MEVLSLGKRHFTYCRFAYCRFALDDLPNDGLHNGRFAYQAYKQGVPSVGPAGLG